MNAKYQVLRLVLALAATVAMCVVAVDFVDHIQEPWRRVADLVAAAVVVGALRLELEGVAP